MKFIESYLVCQHRLKKRVANPKTFPIMLLIKTILSIIMKNGNIANLFVLL